jgi:hypothetical protein
MRLLLDDIRNHLAVMNPGQRERRTAVLLREAAAEIERLRSIMASESYSPQPIDRTPDEPSTPGEGTRQAEGTPEPVAWAVLGDGYEYVSLTPEMCGAWASENGGRIVPLYRSPTLTDAELEAIEWAIMEAGGVSLRAATLRGLLERTK